ncbi:MAG: TerC family protein [Candidatus Solibacter sp.]|nr:TerC family protein [Candidatus Solibacter sp.]
MNLPLFPFADYWWLYLAFTGLVVVLLAIDLTFHRQERPISFRNAATWTAVWISLALAFSYALYLFTAAHYPPNVARQLSLEFLAGYVVEESLSVDNMFVFVLVFRYFAVPLRYQHKVLFYGVLGAMVFRGAFIAAGSALVRFEWVMILFGVFLIVTGIRMAVQKEQQLNPDDSLVIRWVRRFFPVTGELHGSRLLVTVNGIRHITPLMVVLLFLETTDLLFAVDSVPAVFGVTREPFVVYTSNVFAVLGLRAMFFLLAGAMDRFYVLRHGLALVLVFVGLKMVWLDHLYGGRFPIGVSLGIISAVIAASILLSLAFPKAVERAPAPPSMAAGRVVRPAVGLVFLLLSAIGFLYAAGPGQRLLPLPALDNLGAGTLYWAAACNLVCAVVLLGGAWPRTKA